MPQTHSLCWSQRMRLELPVIYPTQKALHRQQSSLKQTATAEVAVGLARRTGSGRMSQI